MSFVELGYIARAHGVRGEVRVALHHPEGNTLLDAESVILRRAGAQETVYRVRSRRRMTKAILLGLEGIESREAAERLRGASVLVPRKSLPRLEEGEYYLCDLVGARVLAGGSEVGVVVEVRVHPTVDCLVVSTPSGEIVEQPLADPWISRIDAEGGLVELSSREGLV